MGTRSPKRARSSKTIWLGVMTSIVSILTMLQGESWIADNPIAVSAIGLSIGILTVIVRFYTTKPIQPIRKKKRQ